MLTRSYTESRVNVANCYLFSRRDPFQRPDFKLLTVEKDKCIRVARMVDDCCYQIEGRADAAMVSCGANPDAVDLELQRDEQLTPVLGLFVMNIRHTAGTIFQSNPRLAFPPVAF